jgi:hypothetical protein
MAMTPWLFRVGRLGVARERRAAIEGWRHFWWRLWWRTEHVTLVVPPRPAHAPDVFFSPPILHFVLMPDYRLACGASLRQPYTIEIEAVTCPACRQQGERMTLEWMVRNR